MKEGYPVNSAGAQVEIYAGLKWGLMGKSHEVTRRRPNDKCDWGCS